MSDQYGVRDAACPLSTREGGGGVRRRGASAREAAEEWHAKFGCVDTPTCPRTNRTRRVPHPVLIGHAVCAARVQEDAFPSAEERWRDAKELHSSPQGSSDSGDEQRSQARVSSSSTSSGKKRQRSQYDGERVANQYDGERVAKRPVCALPVHCAGAPG
jgi:hypothetical protein